MVKTCEFQELVEGYVSITNFDSLLSIGKKRLKISEKDVEYNYIIASMVACVEGNVEIDFKNKLLCFWLGEYHINFKIDEKTKNKYFFDCILNLVSLNNKFYKYIENYFNLWHSNKDSDFTYDKYHKAELVNNFQNLVFSLNQDLETLNRLNEKSKYSELSNIVNMIINVA